MNEESKTSRWDAFSDEEISELAGMIAAADESYTLSDRAEVLGAQVKAERDRRDAQPSYRGPGVYRDWTGKLVRVLGTARYESRGVGSTVVIVRVPDSMFSNEDRAFDWSFFNGREEDGRRRYTYVGPEETEAERAQMLNEEMT